MVIKMLKKDDALIYELLKLEDQRQKEKLILNAAVSITPESVLEVQSSILDNIDAEGYIPTYLDEQSLEDLNNISHQLELYEKYRDDRCNKCCEYANVIESLAKKRLARVFQNEYAKEEDIFVNVQVPTGAIANFLAYEALLHKGDTILSLDMVGGGHITHGSKEHKTGVDYQFIHYHVRMEKEDYDYEEIAKLLQEYHPGMIVAGASNCPFNIDFKKIRDLINTYSPDTLFMADIAHTAGLVAGKVFNNPVGIADVITMVTYKTFIGPRSAVIMSTNKEIAKKIDETVFPYFMGSPLLLNIAGVAVASHLALSDSYKKLQQQIVTNSRNLTKALQKLSVPVVFSKSDSHIVLIDCHSYGNGRKVADYFEDCGIMINECSVPSKDGAHEGLRIGTTWITQLGITDMDMIAHFIYEVLESYALKKNEDIKEKVKTFLKDLEIKNENI